MKTEAGESRELLGREHLGSLLARLRHRPVSCRRREQHKAALYRYYVDKEYFFFGMTIGIVIFAWLFAFAVDMLMFLADMKDMHYLSRFPLEWLVRILFDLLMMAPLLRYFYTLQDICQYWCSGCTTTWGKIHRKHTDYQREMASFLLLVETYIESSPQMVLQFYIIVHDGATFAGNPLTFAAQWLSIVTSLLGVASATYSYYSNSAKYRIKKVGDGGTEIDSDWTILELDFFWDKFLLFFWHLAARVLALGLFATTFSWWVFVIVGIHMSIVAPWAILKEMKSSRLRKFIKIFFVSFIFVFQYRIAGWDWEPFTLMYVLMAVENVAMLTIWSFNVVDVWLCYKILICLLDLLFFIIGIVSMNIQIFLTFHGDEMINLPPEMREEDMSECA
ncbi:unnamed protein product [Darwinula stevensoni]|uniref:XK-related protein n=1 Tax=Darwinula stevensoni TaxID=69355 RepID=A0A7R9A9N5_9CRUS|nr:unnamed protein product [Darwinula stevensoni]CAG0897360.1 unnamed protein product [Darwinula stevensoni]